MMSNPKVDEVSGNSDTTVVKTTDVSAVENVGARDDQSDGSNRVVIFLAEFENIDHKMLLQAHFVYLGEYIELESSLLSQLYALNVVNMQKREEIASKKISVKQIEALIDFLIKGPAANFFFFLYALVTSYQSHILGGLKLNRRQKELVEGMSAWSEADFDALKLISQEQETARRTEVNATNKTSVKCRSDDTPELVPSVVNPPVDPSSPRISPSSPRIPDAAKPNTAAPTSDSTKNKGRESGDAGCGTQSPIGNQQPQPARLSESRSQFNFYGGSKQIDCMFGDYSTMHVVNGKVVKRSRGQGSDNSEECYEAGQQCSKSRSAEKTQVKSVDKVETVGASRLSSTSATIPDKQPKVAEAAEGNRYSVAGVVALLVAGLAAAAYVFGPNISDIFFMFFRKR